MWGLLFPCGPLASIPPGQREQRKHAGLCTVCEYGRNSLPGVSFSEIAQLYFMVREIYRIGTAAGTSPKLCLANYHMSSRGRAFARNCVRVTLQIC